MKWSGSQSQRYNLAATSPRDPPTPDLPSSDPLRRSILDPSTLRKLNSALLDLERLKAERNSVHAENNELRLQCSQLTRTLEDQRATQRAVGHHTSEMRALEDDNKRLRASLHAAEGERRDLAERVKELEGQVTVDRMANTRKIQTGVETITQVQRAKEGLESRLEAMRAELQQYEAVNRELSLSKAQLSRDFAALESERNSLLSQLSDRSRYEQQLASSIETDRLDTNQRHARHSRVLAAVSVFDRIKAVVSRLKVGVMTKIRQESDKNHQKSLGTITLFTAFSKLFARKLIRHLNIWKETTIKRKNESDKTSLLHGFDLSSSKRTLFSIWQRLTYKYMAKKKIEARKARLRTTFTQFCSTKTRENESETLLTAFLAWKGYQLRRKSRFLAQKLTLSSGQTHILSQSLAAEQQTLQKTLTIKAISSLFRQSKAQIVSYITVWKRFTASYKENIPKLKRIVTIWGRSKETIALNSWKSVVNFQQLTEVVTESRKLANKNLALSEHIVNLEKVLQLDIAEKRENREKRLRMAIIAHWKLNLRAGIRLWAKNALQNSNQITAIWTLCDTFRRVLLASGWKSMEKQRIRSEKKAIRTLKMLKLMQKDVKVWSGFYFRDWIEYWKAKKAAKKLLKRTLNRGLFDDRRKGFLSWREHVHFLREIDVNSELEMTNKEKTAVEDALSITESKLTAEKSAFASFCTEMRRQTFDQLEKSARKTIKWTASRRLSTWRRKTQSNRLKIHSGGRLLTLWKRQHLRKGLNSWNFHTKRAIELHFQLELNAIQRDLREQQRSYRAMKDSLEDTVTTQGKELKGVSGELKKCKKEFEGILGKLEEFRGKSVGKTKVCFEMWKNRAVSVRKSLNFLGNVLKRRIFKESLINIKAFNRVLAGNALFERKIRDLLTNLSRFGLKTTINHWQTIVKTTQTSELLQKFRFEQEFAIKLQQSNHYLKNHLSMRIFDLCEKSMLTKCVLEWKKIARKRRKIRETTGNIRKLQEKSLIFDVFGSISRYNRIKKLRSKKVIANLTAKMTKSKAVIFAFWWQNVQNVKIISKTLSKVYQSQYDIHTLLGFQTLYRISHINHQHSEWFRRIQSELLTRALISMGKSRVGTSFFIWRKATFVRKSKENSVKKVGFAMKSRSLRSAWRVWGNKTALERQWIFLETDGPAARNNVNLAHKLWVFRKLLEKEGINAKEFERFTLERETRGSALIPLRAENNPHPITRFFLLWKLFAYRKMRIRRTAKRMQAYHRHSDLFSGFKAWKSALPQYSTDLKISSKHDLMGIISRMERELVRVSREEKMVRKEVDFARRYCEVLERQTRRGQNQAMGMMGGNIHTPMRKALYHWCYISKTAHLLQLTEQVAVMERELQFVATTSEELKGENRMLADENGELRKSTMEGIAFAEALELAGAENREIRLELQDRSAMIQRLLDDNQHLASSLHQLQSPDSSTSRLRPKNY